MHRGWPEHKRNCPVPAKPYWNVRHDLSVAERLVLKGEAVLVPIQLRPEVLRRIHDGNFGEIKCVERAKSAVYWPGYVEEVRNAVAGCGTCQENRNKNPVQPLRPVDLPEHPFEKVGTDLFEFAGITIFCWWTTIASGRVLCRLNRGPRHLSLEKWIEFSRILEPRCS